ncbi:OsmC family protein [Desulfocurvus sp.]|uniref:OsmC family protein n=1 Tax=Desulfocurvus sp. TaxID=2871698 RepID=UPI0025B8B89A|nr:OsmC family protein [Desulfocurvus sp.]
MYGGTDTAPSPMDLLLIGLSGCTGIVMTIAMEHYGVELESLNISAQGSRSETGPGEYADMRVHFDAKGKGVSHETMRNAIREFILPKAPVLCTLSKGCPVTLGYRLDGATYECAAGSDGFTEVAN